MAVLSSPLYLSVRSRNMLRRGTKDTPAVTLFYALTCTFIGPSVMLRSPIRNIIDILGPNSCATPDRPRSTQNGHSGPYPLKVDRANHAESDKRCSLTPSNMARVPHYAPRNRTFGTYAWCKSDITHRVNGHMVHPQCQPVVDTFARSHSVQYPNER